LLVACLAHSSSLKTGAASGLHSATSQKRETYLDFTICTPTHHQIYYSHEIKDDRDWGYTGEVRNALRIVLKTLKGRDGLEDLDVDGRIIL
jgi:hypothetical protein